MIAQFYYKGLIFAAQMYKTTSMKYIFLLLFSMLWFHKTQGQQMLKKSPKADAPAGFVTVDGVQFKIDGKPYNYVGTNFWFGPQLGLPENRARLLQELDQLQALGINNLRIMVASEGPESEPFRVQPPLLLSPNEYNESILEGLDFLLVEMQKRNLYGILVLGDFWHWSGGFAQYLSWVNDKPIPYPSFDGGISWGIYMDYTYKFYHNPRAKKMYWDVVTKIVGRTNSITQQPYTADPTIMSWQLANEPKSGPRKKAYRNWIKETAKMIKKMDPHHLVSTGSEGTESESLSGNRRKNYICNHSENIDYLTAHIWIQNWGWYDPHNMPTLATAKTKALKYLDQHIAIAKEMKMPLVLEEFGIARDAESYAATSAVSHRDGYYEFIFDYMAKNIKEGSPFQACNFWAWGGLGRPRVPRSVWQTGDNLIGDPPHEYQGWYSVYNTDTTTHEIIMKYNKQFGLVD